MNVSTVFVTPPRRLPLSSPSSIIIPRDHIVMSTLSLRPLEACCAIDLAATNLGGCFCCANPAPAALLARALIGASATCASCLVDVPAEFDQSCTCRHSTRVCRPVHFRGSCTPESESREAVRATSRNVRPPPARRTSPATVSIFVSAGLSFRTRAAASRGRAGGVRNVCH